MSDSTQPASPDPIVRSGEDAPRIRPKKSAKQQFASATLVLEACLVLFATMAAHALRRNEAGWPEWMDVPSATTVWVIGGTLMVALLVLSRTLDSTGGYVAGSLVQVPVLATGIAIPLMLLVGAIFVVMWIASLVLGSRIDRERAEYDAAHPETAPNVA
ncbi:DUF4233 domain-containing protein [Paraoerskovia marina]|uniref:DUF4233 domain-containing protein n=1 Tax=Paraoerskovia marina TaxID=545619 RepID=A0A1H1U3N8_9CELL|nr:DUF4233 domain-containing protein [Paraoerskovia marina]SDS67004.1 Protein of unknown function [Paraoerskovia marina]